MYAVTRSFLAVAAAALVACSGARADDRDDTGVRAAERASATQPTNLTRTTLRVRSGHAVLASFAVEGDGVNGAPGSAQPGAVEFLDGRIVADRQINAPPHGNFDTAISDHGHDAPALVRNADGSVFELYGAASTYVGNHPPSGWSCLGREFCEPFKRASAADVESGRAVTALATSPELLLPSVGLSEVSSAIAGDATIIAGQEQPSDRNGQGGTQAYVTYHGASGAFDTDAGAYRPGAEPPPGDGLETISRAPSDDAYFDFAFAGGGSGSVRLRADGQECTLRVDANSAAEAASEIAGTFSSQCPALRARFSAMTVKYDPVIHAAAGTIVGISARGDLQRLGAPSVSCSGIACVMQSGSESAQDVRGLGLHRHFLFGGIVRSGPYVYYVMDVQQDAATWYGAGHNSYALRLACFRTSGPHGATWTWTDCTGHHPFNVSPGPLAPDRVTDSPYVVGAPSRGYGRGMTPYIFTNAAGAQVPQGAHTFPVISAESLTLLPDGRVLIVHGCQSTASIDSLCYAILDPHSDRTQSAGLIDEPKEGGSLAAVAVTTDKQGNAVVEALAGIGDKWGCRAHSVCVLTYAFNLASGTWHRTGAESINAPVTAGFPGSVVAEGDRFVAHISTAVFGTRAALDTFSRPVP